MLVALTRKVSPALERCLLSHVERSPIDVAEARRQHAGYERRLEELGCSVLSLEAAPDLPDSVFVEDAAVVLDELAVIARPGAAARRPETRAVAEALGRFRKLAPIGAPGTLDGGDVLRVGRTLWIGRSERTNRAGRDQLRGLVGPLGYRVVAVPVRGCLHLKSAATAVADGTLLVNPGMLDVGAFRGLGLIEVDPAEPLAANALRVGEAVVFPRHYPRTRRRLEGAGLSVVAVEVAELAKAEGGVTCCSLLLEA